MSFSPTSSERYLSIHLALGQYPILGSLIRERMRQLLFSHDHIQHQSFENEVRDSAIRSQEREGLHRPYAEEAAEVWEMRLSRMRDLLTDVKFSQYFTFEEFEQVVTGVLDERGIQVKDLMLSMNPELAPLELVFEQAMMLERLPDSERGRYAARLQELKVVLIRALISDQLRYINIAKEWYTISDLAEIRRRKIGAGRIGGKAAGMLLAMRILTDEHNAQLDVDVDVPESYYIGSHEMYTFMAVNSLTHWNDQKYKTEEEMRADYPLILRDFRDGEFPPDIRSRLADLLQSVGDVPLIVRSSSLLEDNFGTSFAGKYDSIFLPNQGNPQQNLEALRTAIAFIYASVLNPNALLYRRSKGLLDYDERMAILIQVVLGERHGRYYLPHAAGVAFGRNMYRWAPQIHAEDGFVRLVWGLGTRAVDRVGNDYPRLVALSHPLLRPSTKPNAIRRYSQQFVDLIDLEANEMRTLPVHEVLDPRYPPLRYLVQVDEDGFFTPLRSNFLQADTRNLVLTFDELLRRTPFAAQMRTILHQLEKRYHSPVDVEFTLALQGLQAAQTPRLRITILQCRPQSQLSTSEQAALPTDLADDEIVFSTHFVVPRGCIDRVDYIVYVPPEGYFALPSMEKRNQLARTIGKLNAALAHEAFICVGPGRWGSSNTDLGVPIDYGDIYNTRALVEMAGQGIGPEPEPSLGTHFFQDLMEAQIFPLAIYLDDPKTIFNRSIFSGASNCISDFIQVDEKLRDSLILIRVADIRRGEHVRIVMSDEQGQGIAYFAPDD